MSFSELCKACNIFSVCHESQKRMATCCVHFMGFLPDDYYLYCSCAVKFIEKRGFGDHIGYLDFPDKKEWLNRYELLRLVRSKEEVK
jgi:hypothetical protein